MDPPEPMKTASLPHSAESASRVRPKAAASIGKVIARPEPCSMNRTLQSAGKRARTKARNASRMRCGSWSKTRRNETLAEALAGITVLNPSPW